MVHGNGSRKVHGTWHEPSSDTQAVGGQLRVNAVSPYIMYDTQVSWFCETTLEPHTAESAPGTGHASLTHAHSLCALPCP
jgi:hypothetical protein